MKRIKSVNGWTIYEAVTARDEENYSCEIGCYNIYSTAEVKEYGLAYSQPEWDNVDSLAAAIELCSGSNWAKAAALAEELSSSTYADLDYVRTIESRLDKGESSAYIRDCYSEEVDFLFATPEEREAEDEAAAYDDLLIEAMAAAGYEYNEIDSYPGWRHFFCTGGGMDFASWQEVREWLEGVVFDDPEVSDNVERILHPERFDGTRLYDRVHTLFDERDYHDRARFTARMAEIADELGLTQEQVDGFTSDWEMWFEAPVSVYHDNALLEEGRFYVDPSLEAYRQELAAGIGSEETCDEIETCGIWGRAVLEIGYADIELNITRPEGNRIVAEYFCCLKQADGEWFSKGYIDREADIDWMADNWKDLLHDHMRRTLLDLSAYDSSMDFSTPFVEEESAAWYGLYTAEQCPVEEEQVDPAEFVEDLFRNELLYNEPSPLTIEEAAFNLQCYVESGLDVPADLTAELLREEWNALCEKLHPAEPKQERRSHASYAVLQDPDDGQYYTIAAPSTEGFDTQARRDDWLLCTVAKHHAFSDCGGYDVIEVVVDGRRVEYVGWQPGMLYEFADCETGETVWSMYFPEWDH